MSLLEKVLKKISRTNGTHEKPKVVPEARIGLSPEELERQIIELQSDKEYFEEHGEYLIETGLSGYAKEAILRVYGRFPIGPTGVDQIVEIGPTERRIINLENGVVDANNVISIKDWKIEHQIDEEKK